jgi:hypothetical protein
MSTTPPLRQLRRGMRARGPGHSEKQPWQCRRSIAQSGGSIDDHHRSGHQRDLLTGLARLSEHLADADRQPSKSIPAAGRDKDGISLSEEIVVPP